MSIPGRTVYQHAAILQTLAGFIDVLDRISEMAKVPVSCAQFVAVPVVGQFYLRAFVSWGGKKNQRKPCLFILVSLEFD